MFLRKLIAPCLALALFAPLTEAKTKGTPMKVSKIHKAPKHPKHKKFSPKVRYGVK